MSDERNAIIDYALGSEVNLEIAYETHKAYHELCRRLSQTFLHKLKQKLKENPECKGWIFPELADCNMLSFMIRNEIWPETLFGINDFDDVDKACFLVKTNKENKDRLFIELNAELRGKITGVGWWLRLRAPYNNWAETFDGLKSLYTPDHLLEYITEYILKLSDIISKHYKNSC